MDKIARSNDNFKERQNALLEALGTVVEYRNLEDTGHVRRVKKFTEILGKSLMELFPECGLTEKNLKLYAAASVLHDVGKIGVPDEVINKPGRLTDEEFARIKEHPVIGHKILSNIREMPELSVGARCHHERYDGRGYPEGIAGEDICEEARIIAVADAYDAMTSNRSYRGVLPQEKVRAEIEKGKGSQFDPKFADIMLEMIDQDKDYLMRDNISEAQDES
jgi:putative two-component system response regulator